MSFLLGAIEAQLLADTGRNFLNPFMSVAIIAQGGAVLAYMVMHRKNIKTRELCIPSFISVLFGIMEPALFGVNPPYDEYPCEGAYKICFTSTSLESVEKTKEYLGDRFGYVVYPYADSTTCYNREIILKAVDKGRGMKLVCRYYGADIQDTAALGDSMNDYEMMETAGISVAMGNAFDTLQNMADRILYKLLFFF